MNQQTSDKLREILDARFPKVSYTALAPASDETAKHYQALVEWHREEAISAIEALIHEREQHAIRDYIKPYLDMCEAENGVRICKNCGLTEPEVEDDGQINE